MASSGTLRRIIVRASRDDPSRGILVAGTLAVPCALGRNGVTRHKREGDGATPAGPLKFVACHYRPDRVPRPATRLPVQAQAVSSGWCDDPSDRNYNRPVTLPYPSGHERLWREDHLYDILVVLDWNLRNPIPYGGSAIFFHLSSPTFSPTAGCVAVDLAAMRKILALSGPETFLDVA